MTHRNGTQYGTTFTVSIEAAEGVTTGISAADRARTDRRPRSRQDANAERHRAAGPCVSDHGAARRRAGARRPYRSGLRPRPRWPASTPAAVICEVIKDDGTMARLPDLIEFAEATRSEDRHDRRSDPLSQPHRVDRRARCRTHHADRARRVSRGAVSRHSRAATPHLALVHGDADAGPRDAGARA